MTTNAGEEIAAFSAEDMPRIAPPQEAPADAERAPETVHLARPRDILATIAGRSGTDLSELIESVYPSTSLSSFEKRDAIEALAASAEDIDPSGFWMSGHGRLGEYDPERSEYGLEYVQLTYPDSVTSNERRIQRHRLLRLANVSADQGIRFEMSEDMARNLHDGVGGSDARFRARLALQEPDAGRGAPELPLTANLMELVVLKPGSEPEVVKDSDVLARIDLAPASQDAAPVADAPAAGPGDGLSVDGTGAYDILGARVGQPLDQALDLVQAEFQTEKRLYGRRDTWIEAEVARIEPTDPLAESVILVRPGDRDYLALFHEPLVQGNPITGIARTITFAEGARPTPAAIRDLLGDKYGEIGGKDDGAAPNVFLWSRTRQAPVPVARGEMSVGDLIAQSTEAQNRKTQNFMCGKHLQGIARLLDHSVQSSVRSGNPVFETSYPLLNDAGESVPYPGAHPLWSVELSRLEDAECDTDMVMAVVQTDPSGLVSTLRVLVTSRAYLATVEAAAETALLERTASEQARPVIDF
ncbi:MAG: hypothetical protein ACLFRU_06685 [Paracoccaceae bacterium]